MKFRIYDTETTGLPGKHDPVGVCEIAWVDIDVVNGKPVFAGQYETLLNPGKPIPAQAMAIHHIYDEMVVNSPSLEDIDYVDPERYPVAHYAEFDKQFLPAVTLPWICTRRLAQHIWPDLEGYSNQFLRYAVVKEHGWVIPEERLGGIAPHRAMYDTVCTSYLFSLQLLKLKQFKTEQEIAEYSSKPIIELRAAFGKHRGELWDEIPTGYINWCMNNIKDMNADTKATLELQLDKRQ